MKYYLNLFLNAKIKSNTIIMNCSVSIFYLIKLNFPETMKEIFKVVLYAQSIQLKQKINELNNSAIPITSTSDSLKNPKDILDNFFVKFQEFTLNLSYENLLHNILENMKKKKKKILFRKY